MNDIVISILSLGLIGLGFSLLLAFLNKKLRVKEDPLIEKTLNLLPGLNCGACGSSGCRAFAENIIKHKKIFNGCLPGGKELNETLIKLLGIDAKVSDHKLVLVCHCGADKQQKKKSHSYQGPKNCVAADIISAGYDCIYSCLGFGDCIEVCPTAALSLKDEKIHIDQEKCISCGRCVKKCPRRLFELTPAREPMDSFFVACNSKEKGKNVTAVCKRGCIGCGICTRVDNSPFYLKNNLAYLDYSRIEQLKPLEEAKSKCPTKCIDRIVPITIYV
ncbi:MAG: RnfABCDGE type electron transport complex subunit B [Candidatus Omnitrophota bacterium]|nr:MAG: RnfABCDGE type electron transport complex subunit B [Candidatus Omnitrophota bacterium]